MSGVQHKHSPTSQQIRYSGLNVSSSMYNLPVAVFWGQRRLTTNAIWYNHFQQHSQSAKGKGGGAKGGKQYTYSASVILALCEGVVDSIVNVWASGSTTTTTTLSALGMSFFSGTAAQSPWSYVTTNYPTQARSYALTAGLTCANMALGSSAAIPDNAFECVRANGFSYTPSSNGWINPTSNAVTSAIDCLMSDIIPDLLTNGQYGMGFAGGDIGSLTQFAAYQRAQGLVFSPHLNSQEKATSIIDRWAILANAWIYWSGSQIQFVPLGDTAITANGATYTPVTDVAYNLGLGDFLGSEPVKVTRKDPADCYNRTSVNICDRTIGYVNNPKEYKDQTLVDLYGLRDNTSVQADEVCNPAVGLIVAQLVGKRAAYIRNTYAFKTSYRYLLCLPGTILTLTEPNIGLNAVRVRVVSIKENEAGELDFICEEFPGNIGTYVAPIATAAVNTPTTPNQLIPPGNVNTPAIIEPDSAFTGGVPKVIVAASGGPNWGGCVVNVSFDGTSYSAIGTIQAGARQGVLTSGLAAYGGANPDTGNTLAVDCTQSGSTPTTVTNADAQALRTLSLIAPQPTLSGGAYVVPTNGELLAFGAVATTGTYTANLTYLERGQYGTAAGSHSTGDQFTLVDVLGTTGTSVEFDLPARYIGASIYFKLTSFNAFGGAPQDISTVNEYKYTPTGVGFGAGSGGVPVTPTGLTATVGAAGVLMSWSANAPTDNVTSYTLWRAPGSGAAFGGASAVWSGQVLNYSDVTVASLTAYTYFLTANNAVGASANTAGVNATTGISTGSSNQRLTISTATTALGAPPAVAWYIDVNNTSGAPITIKLPASPSVGQVVAITDETGNAGTNAFTIQTSAGAALTPAATVTVNYGSFTARWNGAYWIQLGG